MATKVIEIKRKNIKGDLKKLLDDAKDERGNNKLSGVAFDIFRMQFEAAMHATTDVARRADLRLASEYFMMIIRAEKGETNDRLMELEAKLASYTAGEDPSDI